MRLAIVLATVLAIVLPIVFAMGCARPPGRTRPVWLAGFPGCPRGGVYIPPLVVRIDRQAGFFEEAYTLAQQIDAPPPPAQLAVIDVPRRRMRVQIRVGACRATSVGTWNCQAPAWLASQEVPLDGDSAAQLVSVRGLSVECASGGKGL